MTHDAENEAACECGNCPGCRNQMVTLHGLIRLLDGARATHMSDGGGACGGCGQPLPIPRGNDGQPLYNPYIRHHHEQMALSLLDAGYRVTVKCEACGGSGLCPNSTGVFYAPTEWLGCPDCQGAGRVMPPAKADPA